MPAADCNAAITAGMLALSAVPALDWIYRAYPDTRSDIWLTLQHGCQQRLKLSAENRRQWRYFATARTCQMSEHVHASYSLNPAQEDLRFGP